MKHVKHWQDYGNIALAAWLLGSPLVLGFETHFAAMATTVAVGILLLATALGAVLVPRIWEDWTETALGAWLTASPLFFAFETPTGIANAVVSGLAVLTLALWAVQDYELAHGGSAPTPL